MKEKLKKLMSYVLIICMVFCMFFPVQVQAAGKTKFNVTKKTIYVGDTFTVKLLNNNKKVKWSTTDGKIKITKKTNKYAKIKGTKEGTTYLKAKVGKKTYKCKVTVKKRNTGWQSQSGNILYNSYDTGNGIVCILKNDGSSILNVTAKVVYYNEKGKMIGTASDYNYAFEGKTQCAMKFHTPYDSNYRNIEYSSYKVNISAETASNTISKAKKISVYSDMEADNVTAEVTNNSGEDLFTIHLSIVWYDKDKKVVGYGEDYAECENSGSVDYVTFKFPYDSNYNTIYPASYKIFVNNAYTYTWMK